MLGLIIKDMLTLKKFLRNLIAIIIFYVFIGFASDSSFLAGAMVILFIMGSISSFAYDDLAKWDKYALSLPITRREMVMSKYLLTIILAVAGAIVALLFELAFAIIKDSININELLLVVYALLAAGLLINSALLPLIYKFGVEKSRLMLVGVLAVPYIIFFLLDKTGVPMPSESSLMVLLKVSPFLLILILYISYLISCSIYSKKEIG